MPAFGSQPGLPAFTAANNKIFMDGKPIRLRGANWFGFEGANAVVDGLWERPMSEYVGFLASQGFNAVRVPLAMDNIANDPTIEYNMVKKDSFFNGISHGRTSLEALDRLVALCAANGLLVMLDVHRLQASVWPTSHGLWYEPGQAKRGQTTAQLLAAWGTLTSRYCQMWNIFAADLFNEPWGGSWASGDDKDWRAAAEEVGDFVEAEKEAAARPAAARAGHSTEAGLRPARGGGRHP